ncbi:MAG TPA: hypothetical protein VHE09_10950 [Rhizomicrobium sp.]|nr:hypothetical protein [Rhizomicrobium sp.]
MQTLLNIAFGAALAGATLGPAGWSEVAEANSRIVHAASVLAGFEDTSPLDHAVARARASLPSLPNGAH